MPLFPCLILHPRVSSLSPRHPVLKLRACMVLPPRDISFPLGSGVPCGSGFTAAPAQSPRAPPPRSRGSGFQEFPSPAPPPACVACSQLLAALTSLVSRGFFLLFVPVGLSPLFLYCCCCGEFGQDLRKQQCLGGPRLVRSPWWVPPVRGKPAEGSGETLQLHTCDCCDSSITLVWLHHGMGFMVKLNTSFLAENLDGLTLRTKFK